mgnify:CR=1 FL=1
MRIREIINEASGITKWVRSDMQPKYAKGAYFDSETSFNNAIMNPEGYYYTAALKSPQHPVTGKPALKFPGVDDPSHPMADKRKQDQNFNSQLVAALGTAPVQAVATTQEPSTILDPNRGGLSTADITKPQPATTASQVTPPAQPASQVTPPAPQTVPPMPKPAGRAGIVKQNQWKQKYGKTHNPDGTPKK